MLWSNPTQKMLRVLNMNKNSFSTCTVHGSGFNGSDLNFKPVRILTQKNKSNPDKTGFETLLFS